MSAAVSHSLYVRTVHIAQTPALLHGLKWQLREVLQGPAPPLFDTPAHVRSLERSFRVMWEAHAVSMRGKSKRSPQLVVGSERDDQRL